MFMQFTSYCRLGSPQLQPENFTFVIGACCLTDEESFQSALFLFRVIGRYTDVLWSRRCQYDCWRPKR